MSEENTAPATGAEAPATVSEVVTPVDGQVEAPAEGAEAEAPPVENKAKERLSLRFSELTSQRDSAKEAARRASEDAAYWRERAQSRQTYEPEPSQQGYFDPSDPQSLADEIDRLVEARFQRDQQAQQEREQFKTVQSLRATLLESGLDGAALIASGADVPFTISMFEALTVSEHPAALADHLGRNLDEAGRIASLTPARQGVELARLEARLASQPRTTNAPPPPSTVGARAVASVDPSNMDMATYIAARESGRI